MIRLGYRPAQMTREHTWAAASILGFFLIGFLVSGGIAVILGMHGAPLVGLGGAVGSGTFRGLFLRRAP